MLLFPRTVAILVLTVLLLLRVSNAGALKIDYGVWEELVLDADFVGIIECTAAGSIVARYQVVESWKGLNEGDDLTLRKPFFSSLGFHVVPVTLHGERFIVAAARRSPPSESTAPRMSTDPFSSPLSWREIPAGFRPLAGGMARLSGWPNDPEHNWFFANTNSTSRPLQAFKQEVLELLALPPDVQEERLLRSQAEKYLFGGRFGRRRSPGPHTEIDLEKKLSAAEGTRAVAMVLLREAQANDSSVYSVLQRGGREETLRLIESIRPETSPLGSNHNRLLTHLRRKTGQEEYPAREWKAPEPTDAELDEYRRQLKERVSYPDAWRAIDALSVEDPPAVHEYLLTWERSNEAPKNHDAGYVLGSFFARTIREDRSKYLRSLLNANDPWIRVAAATYLCFEDREEGMIALRNLQILEGDPGTWAALNLARRGEKAAMPRALEVFNSPVSRHMSMSNRRNLQLRLHVLLSNTAAASNLPQPYFHLPQPRSSEGEPDDAIDRDAIYQYLLTWWKKHQRHATLHDPWLATMELQKID
ncbi:MAG: hypothetical protein WD490_05015 [Opitutales bacterium]